VGRVRKDIIGFFGGVLRNEFKIHGEVGRKEECFIEIFGEG